MKRFGMAVGCLAILALLARAEDFDWSWDEAKPAVTSAPPAAAEGGDVVESFDWEWERAKPGAATPAAIPATKPASKPAVDAGAYNELLKENIELRKRAAEQETRAREAKREADRLAVERADLDRKIKALAGTITELEQERTKPRADPGLEAKLAQAERDRAALNEQLTALRAKMDGAEQARKRDADGLKELEAVAGRPVPGPTVQPGSDLFRKIEEENAQLKERLFRLEEAQRLAEAERGKAADFQQRLTEARTGQEEYRETVERLMKELPAMEKDREEWRTRASKTESELATREREMETLREELRRREYRLVKAERMANVLNQARDEVRQVSDREKRDMHYNMAAVYAKEGRASEAEAEYLRALRIDPTDSASHYNLAILYEEDLKDARRAAIHYRKYLQLAPNAPDRDQVRNWLMRLDMR